MGRRCGETVTREPLTLPSPQGGEDCCCSGPDAGLVGRQGCICSRLQPETSHQVAGSALAVSSTRAQVGQWREVIFQGGRCRFDRCLAPRLAPHRCLGLRCTPHHCRHAAEHEARVAHRVAVERDGQACGDGRDVAVEALRQLVRTQRRVRGRRQLDGFDELAGRERVLHVVEVEGLERQTPLGRAAAQQQARVQRHQHGGTVAYRRAVGHVAAHRAGVAHRHRGEAQAHFAQVGVALTERRPRVLEARRGTDRQTAVRPRVDACESHCCTQIDQIRQRPELFGDPQADVGGPGQQAGLGPRRAQHGQCFNAARRLEARAVRIDVHQRCILGQPLQRRGDRRRFQPRHRQPEHAHARVDDRSVAGAAAQVARKIVGQLLARGARASLEMALVAGRQRHHEAGRAEAALRAVAFHHRLLCRMQRRVQRGSAACGCGHALQVFHRQQRLAVERG